MDRQSAVLVDQDVQSNLPLPFYTCHLADDRVQPVLTTPLSPDQTCLRDPGSAVDPQADGPFASVPLEVMHLVFEQLAFRDGLTLGATAWALRRLERDTCILRWRRHQFSELAHALRANGHFLGYSICDTCDQLLREDCYVVMQPAAVEERLRDTWGAAILSRPCERCTDCYERRGELEAVLAAEVEQLQMGQQWEAERAEEKEEEKEEGEGIQEADTPTLTTDRDTYLRRRCSCCRRAKIVRQSHWCAECHTCRSCRKNWQSQYEHFCGVCMAWRDEARLYYETTTFPSPLEPLEESVWYTDVCFAPTAARAQALAEEEAQLAEEECAVEKLHLGHVTEDGDRFLKWNEMKVGY